MLLLIVGVSGSAAPRSGLEDPRSARPELVLQTGHSSSVTSVAFGPGNSWVATGSTDGSVRIWQAEQGRELRSLFGQPGRVRSVAVSPDGLSVAAAGNDKMLRIWDVRSGVPNHVLPTAPAVANGLAFSPNGQLLAVAGTEGLLRLVNTASGLAEKELGQSGTEFSTLAWSADSGTLAVGTRDGLVRIWKLADPSKPSAIRVTNSRITALSFSADATSVAAGGENGSISLFRPADARSLRVLRPSGRSVLSTFFAAGNRLVAADAGQFVTLWDTFSGAAVGQTVKPPVGREVDALAAAISPAGETVLFGLGLRSARLVDLRSGEETAAFESRVTSYNCTAFSADGKWFGAGAADNTVKLWDLRSGESLAPLSGHKGFVRSLAFDPESARLFSGSKDGTIRLWNLSGNLGSTEFQAHKDGVNVVALVRKGDILLSAGVDGILKVWDARSMSPVRSITVPGGEIVAAAVSPDGVFAVTSSADKTLRRWDLATGQMAGTQAAAAMVSALAISNDGQMVAAADSAGGVSLWNSDLSMRKTHMQFDGETFLTASFTTDGRSLALGNLQRSIRLIQTGDSASRVLDDRYRAAVTGTAFSPDGKWLAAGSEDGSVSLLKAPDWSRKATLVALTGGTDWLTVSREGFFDGSPDSWQQILWRFADNTFDVKPVEAYFSEFYQPGLLSDLIGGRGLPSTTTISEKDRRQPTVDIAYAPVPGSSRKVRLKLKVTESKEGNSVGSGARDLRLFRNGVLVRSWNGNVLLDGTDHAVVEAELPVVFGKNTFTAYVFNKDNVKSSDKSIVLEGPESLKRKGVTYLVAIGVGKYENVSMNLSYIQNDVLDFLETFRTKQEALGRSDEIRIIPLQDSNATKQRIMEVLRDPAKFSTPGAAALPQGIQPEDTVVIYFSGHGFALGKRFYMVPHDTGTARIGGSLEPLAARSISDLDIQSALQDVDAANILLIVDACNAGKALDSEEKRTGPMNSKGLAQFAYEKGMFVLTASQPDETAFVSEELKNSYLTYALVEEGLKGGKADTPPGDGTIYLREWFDYATRRVPEMRKEYIEKMARAGTEEKKGLTELKNIPGIQRPRVFYRRKLDRQDIVIAMYRRS